MSRVTIKRLNRECESRGWKCEVVHNAKHGYFWLDGVDVEWAYSTSIGVYRLNHKSFESWMRSIEDIVNESRAKAPTEE